MAFLRKKLKKGKEYYYLCESGRVDGKPRCVKQIYLGTIDKIAEAVTSGPSFKAVAVKEFGSVWLANLIEQDVGFAKIVDEIVPQPKPKKKAEPSIGEFFLYAAMNRMIEARSKKALPGWFKKTAIDDLRSVDAQTLDSDGFWRKWGKVTEEHVRSIASKLFERLAELEPSSSGCFLFDTTNFYTYMASNTASDLAKRGKNKEGRDWLRQVGLALLVARDNSMPRYYREYEGNRHDSKVFTEVMDDVLKTMQAAGHDHVTAVFDKGMNSEENIAIIDGMPQVHFITSYSPYYAEDLIHIDRAKFAVVDTPRNRELKKKGCEDDRVVAFRTKGEYWGRDRTVVVTYNPRTAAKQRYSFDTKLQTVQKGLYELRSRVRAHPTHWKTEQKILARYQADCEGLHLPNDLYEVTVSTKGGQLAVSFRKNHYRIGRHIDRFGKNILITDHDDWSTDQIVKAALDRYEVEQSFRQAKNDDLVSVQPIRHWTDGKIRCHMLSCVVALCCLRLIELRLERAGLDMTAATAMDHMRGLHSCLCLSAAGKMQAVRMLERPSPEQAAILKAFGYKIVDGALKPLQPPKAS